jgi:glycosyltransferase involved in cell wall biosynthesis
MRRGAGALGIGSDPKGDVLEYFIKEPLVDVVIINWNYGQYVGDAIKSVKDQSYRNFRCILVDNGSNDDSIDRILEAISNHPQFVFHQLPSNLGHLGAAIWSLEHATGEFVTFLDADDVLFPTYLASHLQAHLAAGSSVGFTSSNCVGMSAAGALLTSGNYNMYHFWQQGTAALRPMDRTVRLRGVDDEAYLALTQAVRYVPAQPVHWCWCPGSSNMFRRALLDRTRPDSVSPALFGGVDGFFLPILHALTGALLIDQPLSAYRLHGANDYSTLPSLHGLLSAHPKVAAQSFASYLRMMLWIVNHVDDVVLMTGPNRYWQVVDTCSATHPWARKAFSHPDFKAMLAKRYSRLVGLFGELSVFNELRRRLLFSEYLQIILSARGPALPIAELIRTLARETYRKSKLAYKKLV